MSMCLCAIPITLFTFVLCSRVQVFHRLFRLLGLGAAFDGSADGEDDDGVDDDDDTVMMKSNRETAKEVGRQILRRHGSSVSLERNVDIPKDTSSLLGSSYTYDDDDDDDNEVGDIGLNIGNSKGANIDTYDEDASGRRGGLQKKPLLPVHHSGVSGKNAGTASSTELKFAEMKQKLRSKVESTARR